MTGRLADEVAIVTGAGRGIGAAIARQGTGAAITQRFAPGERVVAGELRAAAAVNAICPGHIDMPANRPEILQRAASLIPPGRVSSREEVAWPAVFLASDRRASSPAEAWWSAAGAIIYHH